jgi:Dolichyl-phosphate-mannose-protein mannosyltransferase
VAVSDPAVRPASRAHVIAPTVLVLAGLTAIALALRIPSLSDSLWADEIGTNYVVNGFGVGSVLHIVGTDQEGTPPLFFWLAWLTKGLDGGEGLRVPSLLAGLAAVPLTYLLGRRTVGASAALVGAALIAIAPFQIFYSTEARAYELVMFFCLLAAVTLLRALDTGRWQWWVAYGTSAAAALYTHYNSFFVLAAMFGWAFLVHPEGRKGLLLANLGAALAFLPWLPEFSEDSGEPAAKLNAALHPLTFSNGADDLLKWATGHTHIPVAEMPGRFAAWLCLAALLIGAVGVLLRLRSAPLAEWLHQPADAALAPILAVAAPIGALIWSLFADTIFGARVLITSSPGLAVTAGALVTAGPRPMRFASIGLLLVAFGIGAAKMLDKDNQRPDYAGVVAFIEESGPPDAPVVDLTQGTPGPQTELQAAFAPNGEPQPSDRRILTIAFPTYESLIDARRRGVPILTALPIPSPQAIAQQASGLATGGRIYLVLPGAASFDQVRATPGPVADFVTALPAGFREVASRTFPGLYYGDESVYVLERAQGTPP